MWRTSLPSTCPGESFVTCRASATAFSASGTVKPRPHRSRRSPVSRRGNAKLEQELERLQVPARVTALRADGLGDFVEPLEILSHARIAGRDLSYRDARFVLGRGDGFIGIWDREEPARPIERFQRGRRRRARRARADPRAAVRGGAVRERTPGTRLYLPRTTPELVRRDLGEPPSGMPAEMREMWYRMAAQGMYVHAGGAPWLIVEEDEDERWRVVMDFGRGGRFHLYAVDAYGEELTCRGRFETVGQAQEFAARAEDATGEWSSVPDVVPPTLIATLRWAQRELAGSTNWTVVHALRLGRRRASRRRLALVRARVRRRRSGRGCHRRRARARGRGRGLPRAARRRAAPAVLARPARRPPRDDRELPRRRRARRVACAAPDELASRTSRRSPERCSSSPASRSAQARAFTDST